VTCGTLVFLGKQAYMANAETEEYGEITGPYPQLALLIRKLTQGMTSRVAARRAGVSNSTISRMCAGDRPAVDTIIKFAEGFHIDPKPLLEAADYGAFSTVSLSADFVVAERQIHYNADPTDAEEEELLRLYRGIPRPMRGAAQDSLKSFVTAAQIARQIAEENTIGKRADRNEEDSDSTDGGRGTDS
jgi:transcriptional regulator with XRE-family HTH domain